MENPQLNKSSVESTVQKFHLKTIENKSAVDISISNAIKKGTVKQYIRNGVSPICDISVDDGVDRGLEGHLLQLKKSCSDLTRQLKNRQCETARYKDEVGFTFEKAKKIKDNRQRLEDRIAQLQKNLNQINIKKQSATHCSKTYEHILERMKKDGIYKQLQKNQMQRQLRNLERARGITETKNFSAREFEKLSTLGLKQANDQVSLQNSIRKNKLQSVNKQSSKKMDIRSKLNQKQKQTDQIQELAACDIQDADLLRLKKFLTVQIFLKNLIKSKMNKLKEYFLPYQESFFQIKSNTSVRDAGSLKDQFINFEKNYNQKTVWVTHLQNQIVEAQKVNGQYKQKLNHIMLEHMQVIEKLQAENKKELNNGDLKRLHQKSFMFESAWERINCWVKVQAQKLQIDQASKDEQTLLKQIISKLDQNVEKKIQKNEKQQDVKKQKQQKRQIIAQKDQANKNQQKNN